MSSNTQVPVTQMLDVTYTIPDWDRQSSDVFNVAIIGAGNINFGSNEGPWNHSLRLEQKLGNTLRVVAIIDPMIQRSEAVLEKKRKSFLEPTYRDTQCYKSAQDFATAVTPATMPHAFVVGCPPQFRGSTEPGKDLEIQLSTKLFPGVPLFVDKPVTTASVENAFKANGIVKDTSVTCSVGYMLRYLKAVQMMKQIITENNLTVMSTIAVYSAAYEAIAKADWWDKNLSGGPVIEQGTHLADLSTYIGGDVDLSTVSTLIIGHKEPAGKLSKIPIDESKIKEQNRIPRGTTSQWKYKNGGMGTFVHHVALQGTNYSCSLRVLCDGYEFELRDPYVKPVLHIRRPGSDDVEIHNFENDDPFYTEFSNFVDVIQEKASTDKLYCSFEDACKTYELTWAIRKAGEKQSQQ